MATEETVSTGYTPRKEQQILHDCPKRFKVVVAHRRLGKTVYTVNELADRGMNLQLKNPQLAYIAPTFTQAKRIAWEMMKEYVGKYPGATFNEAELRCEVPRPWLKDKVKIVLLGAENPGAIRGMYLDGAVLDECQEMFSEVWNAVVRPALSDRMGWCTFIGTPKGHNFLKAIWDLAGDDAGWARYLFKASDTGIIPQDELDAARRVMGEDMYLQEYECDFQGSLVGAYFTDQLRKLRNDGKFTRVPYNKNSSVVTGWDLGLNDTTAIWFAQRVGREMQLIDYVEECDQELPHYFTVLKDKGYHYEEHLLPHDAATREFQTGQSREQMFRDHGIYNYRILPKTPPADCIQVMRNFISKSVIDEKKCSRGILALENYQRKWDEKNKIFSSKPLHNWACLQGDTKIRTLSGWKKIKSLVGKDFYVWGYSLAEKRLVPARAKRCWKTKTVKEVVRVTLDSDKTIECTADHLFLTRDEKWIEAGKLEAGESLMPFYENIDRGYSKVHLNDGSIAEEHRYIWSRLNGVIPDDFHIHHKDHNKTNNEPSNLECMTQSEHRSIHSSTKKHLAHLKRIGYKKGNKKSTEALVKVNKLRSGDKHHTKQPGYFTKELRKKCGEGVVRYYKSSEKKKKCKGCSGIFIGNWKRMYCCVQCKSNFYVKKRIPKSEFRVSKPHTNECVVNHFVIKVERVKKRCNVYDIEVEKIHNFVAEGVIVHNSNGADAFRSLAMGMRPAEMKTMNEFKAEQAVSDYDPYGI